MSAVSTNEGWYIEWADACARAPNQIKAKERPLATHCSEPFRHRANEDQASEFLVEQGAPPKLDVNRDSEPDVHSGGHAM
jgi:hypothetical protein